MMSNQLKYMEKGNITPQNGGCWYCHKTDYPLVFSIEFDTFVHLDCIKEMLKLNDTNDKEITFLAKEFNLL